MPACRHCSKVQATIEVRRTTRGHVCRDKLSCRRRRTDQRVERKAIAA
jgi:hypothetical protein